MVSFPRGLCAVLVLVQILSRHIVVFAEKDNNTAKKTDSFTFVKADNKPIESLVDLKTGVYSIALSGVRSTCGFSTAREGTYNARYLQGSGCCSNEPLSCWHEQFVDDCVLHCRVSGIQQPHVRSFLVLQVYCRTSHEETFKVHAVA